MKIQTQCPECKQSAVVHVPDDEYANWQNGALIQQALISVSNDDRERLITGICPTCWDNIFASSDE